MAIGTQLLKLAWKGRHFVKANSPMIMMILGTGGAVGSAAWACARTAKRYDDIIVRHQRSLDRLAEAEAKAQSEGKEYTEAEQKKDLQVVYAQTGREFVKLYAPPVALFLLSLGLMWGGHYILRMRNVAIVAAYKALDEGFKAYRRRVTLEHGENADYMYRHGLIEQETTEKITDPETGKSKTVKGKELATIDGRPVDTSIYGFWFSQDTSSEWTSNRDYNMAYVLGQMNKWNRVLNLRGHVILNDVRGSLGVKHVTKATVTGWMRDGNGDGKIDFGIQDADGKMIHHPGAKHPADIWIDPNVDGLIYDLLGN